MNRLTNRQRTILICVVLGVVTFAVFWPVLHSDFIRLDDPQYVTENGHVNSGLSWENVEWSFQAGYASNWHPLTWMSHMLDAQLFGLRPGWHHLVNLLLHIANCVLLFLLLQRMTGATWRSAVVAALFALHPLHVESVAWVSERKDGLSTLFFLLTLAAYVRFTECRIPNSKSKIGKWSWYGLALLLFALGLMSKPMLVTLPFVLLLLDVWPLNRIPNFGSQAPANSNPASPRSTMAGLILEKVPFLLLAVASCVITLVAQQKGHSVSTSLPLDSRVANAIVSFQEYLAKTFWPTRLAVFYPHPAIRSDALDPWTDWRALTGTLLLAVMSFSAFFRLKREPWFATGWFWFLGTLVPVIGIVQVGTQAMADRYMYIPSIGLFVCLVWIAAEFFADRHQAKVVMGTAGVAAVVACAIVARGQVNYWRNDLVLFGHALKVTTNNAVAHTIAGEALTIQGKYDLAKAHFQAAIDADPNYVNARYDLGVALARQAFSLAKEGKLEEAAQAYASLLQLQPTALAHNSLGAVLWQLGKTDEALAHYSEALRLDPNYADAHYNLGVALAATGKLEDAATHFAEAVRLKPDHARALAGLGRVLAMQGKLDEARTQFIESLRLNSNSAETHLDYAMCLSALKETQSAIVEYRRALELNEQLPLAYNNLAWMLATHADPKIRNGNEAVALAERACRLTNNEQPFFLGTLAAAYAQAGRFSDAVSTAEKACALAEKRGLNDLVKRNQQLLELYRAGKPYHEAQ